MLAAAAHAIKLLLRHLAAVCRYCFLKSDPSSTEEDVSVKAATMLDIPTGGDELCADGGVALDTSHSGGDVGGQLQDVVCHDAGTVPVADPTLHY